MEPKVELGMMAQDKVSGFRGTATAVISELYAGDRIRVQPSVSPDGKLPECEWFEEGRLEVVE